VTLPLGTEPLVLADGTKINPEDGLVLPADGDFLVEVPNTQDLQREVTAARKRISDLPVPPAQMNTLSVILCYTLFGISEHDLALTLSIPIEQLRTVKMSDAYSSMQASLLDSIMKSDEADVRDLFIMKSRNAANVMFNLMGSESEATRGSAAKDILDRAGQRPVDVIEHKHKIEGGLRIEYIEHSKEDIPIIDVTPEI
jgi:hypothetical protein